MNTTNRRKFFGLLTAMFTGVTAFGRGLLEELQVHHDPLTRGQFGAKHYGCPPGHWDFPQESIFGRREGGLEYAEFKADNEVWRRAWLNIAGLRVEKDGTVAILYRRDGNENEGVVEIDLSREVCRNCREMQTAQKNAAE